MITARIVIGVVAALEILILVFIIVNRNGARVGAHKIRRFLWVLVAVAILAFLLNLAPGTWVPWVSGLLVLGPIAVAALVGFIISMLSP